MPAREVSWLKTWLVIIQGSGVQKTCSHLIIILLERHRMGLFSGRENVDSQLSSDECSAMEGKQSWGRSDGLYSVIVQRLSRVGRLSKISSANGSKGNWSFILTKYSVLINRKVSERRSDHWKAGGVSQKQNNKKEIRKYLFSMFRHSVIFAICSWKFCKNYISITRRNLPIFLTH